MPVLVAWFALWYVLLHLYLPADDAAAAVDAEVVVGYAVPFSLDSSERRGLGHHEEAHRIIVV